MSSPFTQFRKQQKLYLAVLGVLCMIAFVFGGVTCANDQPAGANPVVASTKYGDLHESQMAYMRSNLELVNEFLQRLVIAVSDKTMQNSQFPPQFRNQLLQFQLQRLEQEGLLTNAGEATAVDVMILANKAEELGVVVSDDAIREFIRQQTNNQLTTEEIAQVIRGMGKTSRQIFDALKPQILSVRMRYLFGRGLMAAPPAQQWEYYQRLNRRARAELVPVSVASFVADVKDPTDQELRKFFEENKNRIAEPGSPEPGFKQPHKVALQYLKADYEKFDDEAAVTDEEIAEHYEKNKKNYPYTDPPLELPKEEEKATDEKPDADSDKTDSNKTDKKDAEKPAAEEKKAEPEKSESKQDKKSGEEKKEPASETKEPADDKKENSDKKEPSDESCQSDDAAADKQPEASKPADAPATPSSSAEGDTSAKPAGPDAASPATAPKPEEKGPTLLELSSQYGLPRDIRGGVKPAEAPLWAVKDRIRRELAGERARKKMEETLDAIRPTLESYYNEYALWKSEHPDAKDAASRPTRPDFVALAKKHGLSAHEIGLSSLNYVLTETDLGQAIAGRGAGFVQQALETAPVFKHQSVQDSAGNHYLFWKNQDVPEHVPSFDDPAIRTQVLASWKMIQARDLAKKRAESLAEQARKAQQPLPQVFADIKDIQVVEAGPFTWMTQGSEFLGPQEPRITTIPGVDQPGAEFMRTVFDLAEGETGVAFNAPQTEVYVVRVTGLEPSPRVLMEKFLAETANPRQQQTYSSLSFDEHFQLSRDWIEEVRETAGLHWKREAFAGTMR